MQQKKGNVKYPIHFHLLTVGFLLMTILISKKIGNELVFLPAYCQTVNIFKSHINLFADAFTCFAFIQ